MPVQSPDDIIARNFRNKDTNEVESVNIKIRDVIFFRYLEEIIAAIKSLK